MDLSSRIILTDKFIVANVIAVRLVRKMDLSSRIILTDKFIVTNVVVIQPVKNEFVIQNNPN